MKSRTSRHEVYIDPSSDAYYQDRLFDITNQHLNRDDTLLPFLRLKMGLEEAGAQVYTADRLFSQHSVKSPTDYYSLGVLHNYKQVEGRKGVRLRAFVIFEPPVVDPRPYRKLPELTRVFDEVYVHNTVGDGYSLTDVDQSKLRKLYWPQPRTDVIESHWSNKNRLDRLVVINGNHIPRKVQSELYSQRIKAMVALSKLDAVDLYGRGWDRWWSRASMWWPYWKHRRILMLIYKGACNSKYEVLSRYNFSLCFENMTMQGYVTEKIFDCLYAGTIPIYFGAPDIKSLVPTDAYVDFRNYLDYESLVNALLRMTEKDRQRMRDAGREFIQGELGLRYIHSLPHIFGLN